MRSLPDRAAIEAALREPLPDELRELITGRLSQDIGDHTYDLADVTHFVVVEPGDTDRDLQRELSFSLRDETYWDLFHAHDGWFEVVAIVGNDGFAFSVLVPDHPDTDPELLRLCRCWAAREHDHLM